MKADVQGVGESVLLDLEGYQFLMARDDARRLGMALLRVVMSGGDVLDGIDVCDEPSIYIGTNSNLAEQMGLCKGGDGFWCGALLHNGAPHRPGCPVGGTS